MTRGRSFFSEMACLKHDGGGEGPSLEIAVGGHHVGEGIAANDKCVAHGVKYPSEVPEKSPGSVVSNMQNAPVLQNPVLCMEVAVSFLHRPSFLTILPF